MMDLKSRLKQTPVLEMYATLKSFARRPRSQNDETVILKRLLTRFSVPNTFIEFGFSAWEFNCASLVDQWAGLLIDGDPYNVRTGRTILPKNIKIEHMWIDLETVYLIPQKSPSSDIGILSVDIDGNDYWILEKLISVRPAIVICEYNSSFGLRPVSVPYEKDFSRFKKHKSGMYFGASLSAFDLLCKRSGYSLIEVGNNGINAFFVRDDLLGPDDIRLSAGGAFREKLFPNGSRPSQQWMEISHLPFVDVSECAADPSVTAS